MSSANFINIESNSGARTTETSGVIYLTFLHITQKYTFNANKLHIEHELTRPTFATNIFRRCTLAVLLVWNGFKDIKIKKLEQKKKKVQASLRS